MNISITFRQMEALDSVKNYATDKVGKLQKFARSPIQGEVKLSCQNRTHSAEVDLHAGSHHYHAHETSEDMYMSIDKVADKLERQMRSTHESRIKKGGDRASDHLLPETGDE